MNVKHCIAWKDVSEPPAPSGIAKRAIVGKDVSLVMVCVPAGTKGDRHHHPHEQFVQVAEGSGILETEQGEHAFAAGSVFHFPSGTWHKASFNTDTVLIETNLHATAEPAIIAGNDASGSQ